MESTSLNKIYNNLIKIIDLNVIHHLEQLKTIFKLRYEEIENSTSIINKLILTRLIEKDINLVYSIQVVDSELHQMKSNCIDKILSIASEESQNYYMQCFDNTQNSLNRVFLRTIFDLTTFYNYLIKTYKKRYYELECEINKYFSIQELLAKSINQIQDDSIAMNEIVRKGFIKHVKSYQSILRFDNFIMIEDKINLLMSRFKQKLKDDQIVIEKYLLLRDELEQDVTNLIKQFGVKLDGSQNNSLNDIKSKLIELRTDIIDCKNIKLRMSILRIKLIEIKGEIQYLSKKNNVLLDMKKNSLNILNGYHLFSDSDKPSIDRDISSVEFITDRLSEEYYNSN